MKKIITLFFSLSVFLAVTSSSAFAGLLPTWPEWYAYLNASKMKDGLAGWNLVQPMYNDFNLLDGISLEWDYISVHDKDGKFTGAVTYVVADPRGHLSGSNWYSPHLMPSGCNVALYGKFAGEEPFALYVPFGMGQQIGSSSRSLNATGTGGAFAKITPVRGTYGQPDSLRIQGSVREYSWDLTVRQMWAGYNGEPNYRALKKDTYEISNDIGEVPLSGEHWTVNSLWHTTKVTGTITKTATGQVVTIDGHGYREDSFGRWAFPLGGWDFNYISDVNSKVMWTWQTYHFDSIDADYLDVDFMDNGVAKSVQFKANRGELGWRHSDWRYDTVARQYVPLDTTVIAANSEYIVEAYCDIDTNSAPLMTNATILTDTYVIFAEMPQISGVIKKRSTRAVVATFSGQGGGEFSVMRNFGQDAPIGHSPEFFSDQFDYPFPRY
jgi:hypothetical protein